MTRGWPPIHPREVADYKKRAHSRAVATTFDDTKQDAIRGGTSQTLGKHYLIKLLSEKIKGEHKIVVPRTANVVHFASGTTKNNPAKHVPTTKFITITQAIYVSRSQDNHPNPGVNRLNVSHVRVMRIRDKVSLTSLWSLIWESKPKKRIPESRHKKVEDDGA